MPEDITVAISPDLLQQISQSPAKIDDLWAKVFDDAAKEIEQAGLAFIQADTPVLTGALRDATEFVYVSGSKEMRFQNVLPYAWFIEVGNRPLKKGSATTVYRAAGPANFMGNLKDKHEKEIAAIFEKAINQFLGKI
jgi:hypothetical protein